MIIAIVRVQVPPAVLEKQPVIYGRLFFFCEKFFMQFKIFYIFVNERSQNGVFYVQSFDNNINGSLIIK